MRKIFTSTPLFLTAALVMTGCASTSESPESSNAPSSASVSASESSPEVTISSSTPEPSSSASSSVSAESSIIPSESASSPVATEDTEQIESSSVAWQKAKDNFAHAESYHFSSKDGLGANTEGDIHVKSGTFQALVANDGGKGHVKGNGSESYFKVDLSSIDGIDISALPEGTGEKWQADNSDNPDHNLINRLDKMRQSLPENVDDVEGIVTDDGKTVYHSGDLIFVVDHAGNFVHIENDGVKYDFSQWNKIKPIDMPSGDQIIE